MSKEKCGATCSDGSECQNYPIQGRERCRHHGGKSTGPKTEAGKDKSRMNAVSHGLYAVPDYLKPHLSEEQQDRYTAYFEALCSRYERLHSREPDDFAKDRLSRVAIECVKERIADEYLAQEAESSLLTQQQIEDTQEGIIQVERENHILKELTALKRETRLTLKDMGLLKDPESKQADATETLIEVLKED